MTTNNNPQLETSVVIYSAYRAAVSQGIAGFWSNSDGWTTLEGATLFTIAESRTFGLPLGAAACWLPGADAGRIDTANRIKAELRNDGFDVAQAQDNRWYGADEQDFEDVVVGDHLTEELAWRDLAEARSHVLEDAGLEHAGIFTAVASSEAMARQHRHDSADATTALYTAVLHNDTFELHICGCSTTAYFVWRDQQGDPVGHAFQEVNFDQVEETLPQPDRDAHTEAFR